MNTLELLYKLENIDQEKFDRIIIKYDKFQFEIYPTGITNSVPEMFECFRYDGNYHDTTLNNIISCIQANDPQEYIIER